MRAVTFLASERRRQGKSQAELGSAIGRTQSTIAKWEGGHVVPNAVELFQWADALSVSLTPERLFRAAPAALEAA